jgi:hypothetical protein
MGHVKSDHSFEMYFIRSNGHPCLLVAEFSRHVEGEKPRKFVVVRMIYLVFYHL